MQIQIADEVGSWLRKSAAEDGKSPEDYASEAVLRFLEDREDHKAALEVSRRIASGEERTSSLEEVERRLGLDD